MSLDPIRIIEKFYDPRDKAYALLVAHSRKVAAKALETARRVPHLDPNPVLIREAALLHDIGIFLTDSPRLGCIGRHPYVCHGWLGAEILEEMGLPRHAAVCERHVGAGLTAAEIRSQGLPLPRRDMVPETIEERIVAYADKFYSKLQAHPGEKPLAAILGELGAYSAAAAERFRSWAALFGNPEAMTARQGKLFTVSSRIHARPTGGREEHRRDTPMAERRSHLGTAEFSAATGAPMKKITRWLREGTLEGTKETGKWRIPADQVARVTGAGAGPDGAPAVAAPAEPRTCSVEEFSAMTYLTPFGVTDWLRKGLLSGRREAGGEWRVDADNLESERVRRLRRR